MTRLPGRDVTRPADSLTWPEGSALRAVLGFDMDAESVVLAIDRANADRMSVMSHRAYGPVTGMPRILSLLARHDLRATFFCPGYTAERYPTCWPGRRTTASTGRWSNALSPGSPPKATAGCATAA